MDEPSQNTRRPHRTWAEAKDLVSEFERSEMTREEFCRAHGISSWSLSRYRSRLRREQQTAAGLTEWVAVEVCDAKPVAAPAAGSSGLVLSLPGERRIELGRGFDAQTLTALLSVLERR